MATHDYEIDGSEAANGLEFELTVARARETRLLAERARLMFTFEALETENARLLDLAAELEDVRGGLERARGQAQRARHEADRRRDERTAMRDERDDALRAAHEAQADLEEAQARLDVLEPVRARADHLQLLYEDLTSSVSWRMTRPLRWGIARLRSLRPGRR
jgi:chromosome segregation ATPase